MIKPRHLRTKTAELRSDRRAQRAERAGDRDYLSGKIDADVAHFIVLVGDQKL